MRGKVERRGGCAVRECKSVDNVDRWNSICGMDGRE